VLAYEWKGGGGTWLFAVLRLDGKLIQSSKMSACRSIIRYWTDVARTSTRA